MNTAQRLELATAALEQVQDAVLWVEFGLVSYANAAASRMFGLSVEALRGSPLQELLQFPSSLGDTLTTAIRRSDQRKLSVDVRVSEVGERALCICLRELLGGSEVADYRTLVENLPQAVFLKDLDLVYVSCNSNYAHDRGLEPHQVIGRTDHELHPPELSEKYRRDDRAIIAAGHTVFLEEVDLGSDTNEKVVQTVKTPVMDSQGRCIGLLGIYWDITEQRRAKLALEESESRYRTFVENLNGIAFQGTLDFVPLFIHGAVESTTGYSAEQLVAGEPRWDTLIHPDDYNEEFRLGVARLRTTPNTSLEREYRIVRRDGAVRWIHEFIQTVSNEAGEAQYVRGVVHDITDRKQAEAALRRSEELFRRVFEDAPLGMAFMDMQGRFLDANGRLSRLFGRSPGNLIDVRFCELLVAQDLGRWQAAWEPLAVGALSEAEGEFQVNPGEGVERVLHVRLSVLRQDGRPQLVLFMAQDISRRQQAEAASRRYAEELERVRHLTTINGMATLLAHELNQPLAAVVNYIQGSLSRLGEADREQAMLRRGLEMAMEQAQRAGSILRNARETMRRGSFDLASQDPNALVRDVLSLARSSLKRAAVDLQTTLTEGLPLVEADRFQVHQVLLNLIRNAADAMLERPPSERVVAISTALGEGGNEVLYAVRDRGCGLPAVMHERLVHPFHTTKPGGSGLGLPICQFIVDSHGGRLWATPNSDGIGTTFHFTLPL